MVTNYPHPFATKEQLHATEETHAEGFSGRMMDRLRQVFCGLHGHDTLLQFEHDRMFLRCVSCGHETPGWELNETPPTVTIPKQVPRHAVVRPQLVGARRLA